MVGEIATLFMIATRLLCSLVEGGCLLVGRGMFACWKGFSLNLNMVAWLLFCFVFSGPFQKDIFRLTVLSHYSNLEKLNGTIYL